MAWSNDGHRKSAQECLDRGVISGNIDHLAEIPEPQQSASHEARVSALSVLNELGGPQAIVSTPWHPDSWQPPVDPPPVDPPVDPPIDPDYDNVVVLSGVNKRYSVAAQDNTLYLGEDGATLDGDGVTQYAFHGKATNVGIRNLKVTGYTSREQYGPINAAANSKQWVVQDCEIFENAYAGISLDGDDHVIRNCHIHHNHQIGIKVRDGDGSLVEDCVIEFNNWLHEAREFWEAGGCKFARNTNLTVRNNEWLNNVGPGLWVDIDNHHVLLDSNTSKDNTGPGIFYEINGPAVISNNVIARCGSGMDWGWLWGAGLLVSTSYDLDIHSNTVTDCRNGIGIIDQNRGGSRNTADIGIYNNTVVNSGKTGAVTDRGNNSMYNTINFEGNSYSGGSFNWKSASGDLAWWKTIHPADGV